MSVPTVPPFTVPGPDSTDTATFDPRVQTLVNELLAFPAAMNAAIVAINAGGFPTHRTALSGAYTAVQADNGTIFDCSGTFTLSFTAAATLAADWWCIVANRGTGNITLDPNGSETVDGQTTGTVYPGFV